MMASFMRIYRSENKGESNTLTPENNSKKVNLTSTGVSFNLFQEQMQLFIELQYPFNEPYPILLYPV